MQAPQSRPSLLDLHDIVLPEPVSWAPATTAWYVLGAALLLGIAAATFWAIRRHEANRYRREALARIDAISKALGDPARRDGAMLQIPELTKQVALAVTPRTEVAGLSGDAWLEFLDSSFDGNGFTTGAGRLLPDIAYGSPASRAAIPDHEIGELTALIRAWIRGHHVRV